MKLPDRLQAPPENPVGLLGVLLLADSRFPAGGHAHSQGVEAVVRSGMLTTPAELSDYLAARLGTTGVVAAAQAAAAHQRSESTVDWNRWEQACAARNPSAAQRAAAKAQGAALLRSALVAWPNSALRELAAAVPRPHHALTLGVATASAGGSPVQAAHLALHHLIGGACSAALRLLGLDPLEVAAVQARLAGTSAQAAESGALAGIAAAAEDNPALLPTVATPLPDILAEQHAHTEVTLFAS
jgi:urease accessory protein